MSVPILKLRDENGNIIPVPAIVGPPGPKPVKGVDYWTAEDKAEIVEEIVKDVDAIIDVDALPETDIDETVLYRLTTDNNDLYQYKNGWHRVSGAVQSDWDAAEGESGHVLNRTHHRVVKMEPFEVDILELDAAGAPYYDLSAVLGEGFTIFQIRETALTQEQLNGAQVYFEEVDYVGYGNVEYDADTSAAASEMAGGTIEWYSYHTDRASVAQDADYGSILVIPEDLEIAGMGTIQKGTYQRSVLLGTSNYLGWTFKNEVISPLEAAYAPQPDVHHFVFTSTDGSQYYDASAVPIEVGTSKTFAVNNRFKNHIKQNKPVQIELNINSYASTAGFLLHFPIRDAAADSFYKEQVVYSCDLGVLFIEFTVAGSSLTIKVDNLADKMGCITSADTVNVAEEGM